MTVHLDDLRDEELIPVEEYNKNHKNDQISEEEAERLEGVFRTPEQIKQDISQLAEKVNESVDRDILYVVGILNGVVPFLSDLTRDSNFTPHTDWKFVRVNCYPAGMESQEDRAEVMEVDDLSVIENSPVLVVDELSDKRNTLKYVKQYLEENHRPSDIQIAVYLDKRDNCEVDDLEVDHIGHLVDGEHWVVGYGMDITETKDDSEDERSLFRNKDYVAVHKPY